MGTESFTGITVPFIGSLVYLLIEIIKKLSKNNKTILTFAPIIATALGAAIAVFCFFVFPSIVMSINSFSAAIIIGAASGLAATGTHQIFKQMSKQEKQPEEEIKQQ